MKMRQILGITVLVASLTTPTFAEDEEEKKVNPLSKAKTDLREKYREIKKASKKTDGLLPLFQDQRDGSVYLEVKPDQLGKEMIYFAHTVDGVSAAWQFRGRFNPGQVLVLERRFDKIDFVIRNHSFYFDPNNAISRAADANVSDAVVASAKIVGQEKKSKALLVEADPIFLAEVLKQVKPSPSDDSKDNFTLGALSKERTKYAELRNYPKNTEVTVEYVFEDTHPKNYSEDDEVTDSRFVSITMQHSFLEMPENNYEPRFDDPRVGYFNTTVTDMTSTSNTPYRDLIHRWHLEPKDPDAEVSEPVEPITWWIENTTPVELRKTVEEASLLWNEAFESAGWKNAVVIKTQPDDADWDAGDVRYNVMRWTSSPNPRFGGYGPSFANPRTGQILGADIMLEWVFLTNRVRYSKVFRDQVFSKLRRPEFQCFLNNHLQHSNVLGKVAIKMGSGSKIEEDRLMKEALHYLIIHEIGHTLGLGHNFRASTLHNATDVHNRDLTEKGGVTASIMDYPALNLAPDGVKQGNYYNVRPGPYDHWAIQYGYARKDADQLEELLAKSTEPGLAYANDSDDMRSSGKAIDPRNNIGDMSNEPILYGTQRMDKVRGLLKKLLEDSPEEGRSFQTVTDEHETLLYQYESQLKVISRYVGGVYIDRAVVGQAGGTQPLTPVSKEDQARALAALAKYAFAPDAFDLDPKLFAHFQIQRRGWEFEADGEDPKLMDRFLEMQDGVLAHVLHKNTVTRILNSELYGNEMPLDDVLAFLTESIFDFQAGPAGDNFLRQNLQRSYVERLIDIAGLDAESSYPQPAQSTAFKYLLVIQTNAKGYVEWKHLERRLTQVIETKKE